VFLSRLSFHTLPGKTDEVEGKLMKLLEWVEAAGGSKPRIMRTHFGSIGEPDLLFEQEAEDLGALETQIQKVTANGDFHSWSQQVSGLLQQASKRELFRITGPRH
jgi:hypothetical protein